MAYNKKNWIKQKEEEKKKWAKDAVEQIKLYERKPEDVKAYLDFMARMHNYSPRNTAMIFNQFPGAGFVGSKDRFKELGYEILPDQKGIDIMVPTPVKYFTDEQGKQKQIKYATKAEKEKIAQNKLDTTQRTFYSLKPVYDVTQTNAKPEDYPKIYPNGRVDFDVNDKKVVNEILGAAQQFLNDKGIPITTENFSTNGMGAAKGYFSPKDNRIALNQLNTSTENMTVLIHETAHAIMHREKSHLKDTPVKEFEAELTSYIVNKHFGIDTSEYSKGYIADWTKNLTNVKDVESSLKNISSAASQIIEGIEENMENLREKDKMTENILSDKNEIRLQISGYQNDDYKQLLELHGDKFKQAFQSDHIQVREGTEQKLTGQKDSLYEDRSYIVIQNQSDLKGEHLKEVKDKVWTQLAVPETDRTGNYFDIHTINIVKVENDHLSIENQIAPSTDLDLKGKTGEELEFYKKSIELFDKTNNTMTVDNIDVHTDKPMSFNDFKLLHGEIKDFISYEKENSSNEKEKEIVSSHELDYEME